MGLELGLGSDLGLRFGLGLGLGLVFCSLGFGKFSVDFGSFRELPQPQSYRATDGRIKSALSVTVKIQMSNHYSSSAVKK